MVIAKKNLFGFMLCVFAGNPPVFAQKPAKTG
jgi:hypothetical protein